MRQPSSVRTQRHVLADTRATQKRSRVGIPADVEGVTAALGLVALHEHVRDGQHMAAPVDDETLMSLAAHHAGDLPAALHLDRAHGVEGAVLGPKVRRRLGRATVHIGSVLGHQLGDGQMVFQELHPGCERSDRSTKIVDLAH